MDGRKVSNGRTTPKQYTPPKSFDGDNKIKMIMNAAVHRLSVVGIKQERLHNADTKKQMRQTFNFVISKYHSF